MFCFASARLRVFYIPNVVDAPKVRAMALACLFLGVADLSVCFRSFFTVGHNRAAPAQREKFSLLAVDAADGHAPVRELPVARAAIWWA